MKEITEYITAKLRYRSKDIKLLELQNCLSNRNNLVDRQFYYIIRRQIILNYIRILDGDVVDKLQ
ncbi:hypothetical protein [Clostridium sp.]|uniref:hypothetical protein n=1 Tax=Clostridium sp. TaxID=1506 RepID=UPI00321764D9